MNLQRISKLLRELSEARRLLDEIIEESGEPEIERTAKNAWRAIARAELAIAEEIER